MLSSRERVRFGAQREIPAKESERAEMSGRAVGGGWKPDAGRWEREISGEGTLGLEKWNGGRRREGRKGGGGRRKWSESKRFDPGQIFFLIRAQSDGPIYRCNRMAEFPSGKCQKMTFRTETGIEICNSSRNISPPGLISINSSSWEGDDSGAMLVIRVYSWGGKNKLQKSHRYQMMCSAGSICLCIWPACSVSLF